MCPPVVERDVIVRLGVQTQLEPVTFVSFLDQKLVKILSFAIPDSESSVLVGELDQ